MSNFFNEMLPYARIVKEKAGQPISLTLAHWALESTKGTSKLAKATNNMGGIKFSKNSKVAKLETSVYPKMKYAKYDTLEDFTTDYIRVLDLSYYDELDKAYLTPGITDDIKAMHESPYAEDKHQDKSLLSMVRVHDLTKYDSNSNLEGVRSVDTLNDADLKKYATAGLLFAGALGVLGLISE